MKVTQSFQDSLTYTWSCFNIGPELEVQRHHCPKVVLHLISEMFRRERTLFEMKQCTCLFGFPSPEVISSEIRTSPMGFLFLHAHVFNVTIYMYMHPKMHSNVSCIFKDI